MKPGDERHAVAERNGVPIAPVSRIFLPGFTARASTYAHCLPRGWDAVQPPALGVTRGSLSRLREWAVDEVLRRPGATLLAGHSMGAALAILAASTVPEHVDGLVLIAPAGLPITKPAHRIAGTLVRRLAAGTYASSDVAAAARDLVSAPRSAIRLTRSLRRLNVRAHMERVRAHGIPALVVGCTSDTLVTPEHCRRVAGHLGGEYRELALPGGHVWMLHRPHLLAAFLDGAVPAVTF